jgi:hypothetical protein
MGRGHEIQAKASPKRQDAPGLHKSKRIVSRPGRARTAVSPGGPEPFFPLVNPLAIPESARPWQDALLERNRPTESANGIGQRNRLEARPLPRAMSLIFNGEAVIDKGGCLPRRSIGTALFISRPATTNPAS